MDQDLLIQLRQQVPVTTSLNDDKATDLLQAAKEKDPDQIEALLSAGASPNFQDEDGNTALHLSLILSCSCDSCIENAQSCCAVLLNSSHINVNIQNREGLTALHLAAQYQLERSLQDLINKGADFYICSNDGREAVKVIANRTPYVMCNILDNCVTIQSGHPRSENCEVNIDFRPVTLTKTICLDEDQERPLVGNELKFLKYLLLSCQESREKIFLHPVTGIFLDQKWHYSRYQIYGMVLISMLWLLFYTSYIIYVYLISCPCQLFRRGQSTRSNMNSDQNNRLNETQAELAKKCLEASKADVGFLILFALTIVKTLYILGEIIGRRSFTKLNVAKVVILCMALATFYPTFAVQSSIPGPQYELAALTVFLAWASSLSLLGKFPTVGLYLEMFGHVLNRFWMILPTFVFLFIAFALAFCILFPGAEAYTMFGFSLLKVLVMMVGEMEYEDTFYNKDNDQPFGPITGHILYATFVIVVAIVLMNLLVGLTVTDIQNLEKEAQLTRISRQVAEMHHLESIIYSSRIPSFIGGIVQRFCSVTLNLEQGDCKRPLFSLRVNDHKDKTIPEALKTALLPLVMRLHNERQSKICQKKSHYDVATNFQTESSHSNMPSVQVIESTTTTTVLNKRLII